MTEQRDIWRYMELERGKEMASPRVRREHCRVMSQSNIARGRYDENTSYMCQQERER